MKMDLDDQRFYEDYYSNQAGNGLGFYSGRSVIPRQRGEGIGNFLRSAGKVLKPLLASGAKAVGRNLLDSGVGLIKDVIGGKSFKEAGKARLKEGGQNILSDLTSSVFGSAKKSPSRAKKRRATSSRVKKGTKKRRVVSKKGRRNGNANNIFA